MNWELCCFLIMICFVQWKGNTGESTQKHRTVKWIHFTVPQQSFIMWFHICAAHIQFHQMQVRNVNFIRWKHKFSQISIYFILFSCFFFRFFYFDLKTQYCFCNTVSFSNSVVIRRFWFHLTKHFHLCTRTFSIINCGTLCTTHNSFGKNVLSSNYKRKKNGFARLLAAA